MIIAFMGNDGSGKTTLAKEFVGRLRVLGMDVHYRAEFNYFLLGFLFRLLGEGKINKSRRLFLTKESKVQKPVYFKIWPYLVWLDLLLELLWNRLFKHKSIIVMDRYAYDFLMSWEWLGYSDRLIRWVYLHFPKPDIAFVCDAHPRICYSRKRKTHNYSLEFYEVQRRRYLDLAGRLKVKIIDTEKSVESSLKEVLEEFRKFFINKLSDEDKVLILLSYPHFSLKLAHRLEINWDSLNWKYIIDMATKNNVELLLCKNLLRYYVEVLPSQIKKKLNEIVEICERKKKRMINIIKVILEEFSKSGIQFIVFKTFPPFEYVPTDIDILVKQSDFENACEILDKISKAKRVEKAMLFGSQKGARFSISEDLMVDLHSKIVWGKKAISSSDIFSKKISKEVDGIRIFVPSTVDELRMLIFHCIYEHEYITLSDNYWISSLVENIDDLQINDPSRDEFFLFAIINIRNFVFGLNSHQLIDKICKRSYVKIKYPLEQLIKPTIFIQPSASIITEPLHFSISLYRRLRFKATGRLPFNENWLIEYEK
jgi:thymidylate kinase